LSNTRKQQPEKISADCPHCGFSQLESAYAKSTICKRCSQHFSIEKLLAKEVSSLKPPSFFERLGKLVSRESVREISCFSCHATQQVSTAAESSLCPKCGSYIDLRDFRISGPFGRTVQTQGKVTILPKGEVTTRILCGEARIEGKLRGQLSCTGVVEMQVEGKVLGAIDSEKIIVERRSKIECTKPLRARAVEINGQIIADILCDGRVTINKHGILTGSVQARSIVVEKGGVFCGDLRIAPPEPEPASEAEVAAAVLEEGAATHQEQLPLGDEPSAPAEPVVEEEAPPVPPTQPPPKVPRPSTLVEARRKVAQKKGRRLPPSQAERRLRLEEGDD
jgi:cytoskeletal protein CcmA (bactofilin family)